MYVEMNIEKFTISTILTKNNPIIAIPSREKFNRENFVKWKSNMNIVLICGNYKFFLIEECPLEPVANAFCTV